MQQQRIEEMIKQALPDAQISIETADNVHFDAIVIAQQFEGLSRIKRQQLVYGPLQSAIQEGQIHALSLKTLAPSEVS